VSSDSILPDASPLRNAAEVGTSAARMAAVCGHADKAFATSFRQRLCDMQILKEGFQSRPARLQSGWLPM